MGTYDEQVHCWCCKALIVVPVVDGGPAAVFKVSTRLHSMLCLSPDLLILTAAATCQTGSPFFCDQSSRHDAAEAGIMSRAVHFMSSLHAVRMVWCNQSQDPGA